MKVAIDISPLENGHFLQHRVRGTGFYLTNLKDGLLKYFPDNEYIFFKRGDKIPKNVQITHYPYFEPFFLTLPIIKHKKTIVTVHDLIPLVFKDKFPPGIKGKLKWETQKRILQKADAIITDSHSSKRDIHKFARIPNDKIHVVYLAASEKFKKLKTGNLKSEIQKKYDLPDSFLLYVGDVTWNKNLPSLIKSVLETDYHLVIVGSAFANKDFDKTNPWNKGLHEAQVLSENNDKFRVLGFVPDSDLAAIYNLATSFIMPSFYEGFGLPVLEAMQSGCPVITTKEGSLEEVSDSAVYFIDPYSVDSIRNGIEKVMQDKALRLALSKKGISQAKKFSWKKTAEETVKVYESVIRN